MENKICSECFNEYPTTFFRIGRRVCRYCYNIEQTKYRTKNRDRVNNYKRNYYNDHKNRISELCKKQRSKHKEERSIKWRKECYGLSPELFSILIDNQKSCCGICGSSSPGKSKNNWPIDHDHETGFIRGLLCDKCNRGLGLLGDTLENIVKAVEYLTNPPAYKILGQKVLP